MTDTNTTQPLTSARSMNRTRSTVGSKSDRQTLNSDQTALRSTSSTIMCLYTFVAC